MKKALIVANLAGFASFLLSDIDTLQELGYSVSFAANGNKMGWEDTKANLDCRNVPFIQIDFDSKIPYKNIKAFNQISKLLEKGQFDVIHCHTPITGLIVRLLAQKYRRKGTKVLYTTHGFSFTSKSSIKSKLLLRSIEEIASCFCDAIITINKEDYLQAQKMHCSNVYYIPGVGVDTQKYRSVEINRSMYRQSLGVCDDEIMILSVGELSARKNHQIVIKALSRVNVEKKIVYVICGSGIDGGTGPDLVRLAKEHNVKVILLGFRHDIPEITKCSDIGAIPSIREGLGLAGIQSLAAGIPVVGSNVQGIKDYILDGETGFLCDAFSVEEYSMAIEKMIAMDCEERKRMQKKCIEKAQLFDLACSKRDMYNIYRQLLNS